MRDFFQSEQKKPKTGCMTKLFWLVFVYLVAALIFATVMLGIGATLADALSMGVAWPYFLAMAIIIALADRR
jgi:Flp pilus assembly protein TadB